MEIFETLTVQTTTSENSVEVSTGPLKFVIDKNRFGLLDNVWLDVNGDGEFQSDERITGSGADCLVCQCKQLSQAKQPAPLHESGIHLLNADGTVYTSLNAPDVVEVEESGPMRAVVRIEGTHKNADGKGLFAYIARIHAYAGKSYVRVFYTFGNNALGWEFTSIKSLALKVSLNVDIDGSTRLFQNFDDHYTFSKNGKVKEYGMLNFGDWWGERKYNWGNIEYDTQHAFFLQYVRTGDMRFFSPGEQAARHNMDVDTAHYAVPSNVGGVYAHCMGHVGDYDWIGPTAIPRGGFSVSHTWVEGLLDYYFLTGDKRSLETAKKIADRYDTYSMRNYDFGNCRTAGWHLILTMAMYNATNDRFYLNAGKIIVDRVLERQTPETGGWERMLVPGHCHCEPPRHVGNAGFMVGILLAGLKNYFLARGVSMLFRQ